MQIVFQNPDSALNRRHTVRQLIARPLEKLAGLSGAALRERLLDLVGPSGWRSGILPSAAAAVRRSQAARRDRPRLRRRPGVVVCDEPTSALDVSVQAAILNLLADLQAKEQVTYLFISHDLGLMRTCRTGSWCCTSAA